MKIVILTAGSTGDVVPMIALGRELKAKGVEIVVATHCIFKDTVENNGLKFAHLSGNPKEIIQGELGEALVGNSISFFQIWHNLKKIQQLLVKDIVQDAWKACEGADAIIYSTLMRQIAPSIAECLKIKKIPVLFQPLHPTRQFPCPVITRTEDLGQSLNLLSWSLFELSQWIPFRNEINQWRVRQLGLPKISENYFYLNRIIKEEELVVYPISSSFFIKPVDWDKNIFLSGFFFLENSNSWRPSNELSEFLSRGDKPIYLGFGSMVSSKLADIYAHFIDFITKNRLRAIISTGWSNFLPKSPSDSILVIKEAPHDWLFQRVSSAIHHGGLGTTAAVIKAGIPNLAIPFAFDQNLWGSMSFKAGLGPKPIALKKYRKDLFEEALWDLLNNHTFITRSRDLSLKIQEEKGVEKATEKILDLF